MEPARHPLAPEHLPYFLAAPGEPDWTLINTAIFLVLVLLGVGALFFRLHTLPERMAHRSQKLQFEIVAVLGLLALFTHQHVFWVAGLILALVDLPDISSPMKRMADALDRLSGRAPPQEPATGPTHPATPAGDPRPAERRGTE